MKVNPLHIQVNPSVNVAKNYSSKLSIRLVQDYSNVLELKLRDNIPEKASDILNTLIKIYNKATIEDQNRVTEQHYSFY